MSITLTRSNITLNLPEDLYWSDEDWSPVEQSVETSLTGALIIQSAVKTNGRPLTLQPEDDSSAAMTRDTLTTLRNWAADPASQMTLTLRGQNYNVIFRHQDKAIESRPFVHYSDVADSDFYFVTLRFTVI